MSNTKTKPKRVAVKFDVPVEIKDKLEHASIQTGISMTLIFQMLVEYYLGTPLDIEADVRRVLLKFSEAQKRELRLTKRQIKVIEDVTSQEFTKELI